MTGARWDEGVSSGSMTAGGLEIATSLTGGVGHVDAAGEIDLATVEQLVEAVMATTPAGGTVEIDLREVSFMDSSGVAALNRCRRHAAETGATLVIRCVSGGPVAQLLEWTGLTAIVDVRIEH
jgi:anti-anti-sigma factor